MKIETLIALLQHDNPTASAWIPSNKFNERSNVVKVVFGKDGKVYSYRATILAVAERLDLIPEIDIQAEAERVIATLRSDADVLAPVEILDTVNQLNPFAGQCVACDDAGVDEYGRKVGRFHLINRQDDPWL